MCWTWPGAGDRPRRACSTWGCTSPFFPQLIAGPIVKYETVAEEILHRRENWDDFTAGVQRFLVGLGKKVILSNQLAVVADAAFNHGQPQSVAFAWLGAVCYILQLYYDFGGYSDMAIGLGRMFGFHFLENFDYPYISTSVTEFWRRWHISLTSWFRDYVYFPLGGSRVDKKWKVVRNIFVVWLLTGIWHGANWTYVVWGLMNYALLMLEKYGGMGKGWPKASAGSTPRRPLCSPAWCSGPTPCPPPVPTSSPCSISAPCRCGAVRRPSTCGSTGSSCWAPCSAPPPPPPGFGKS